MVTMTLFWIISRVMLITPSNAPLFTPFQAQTMESWSYQVHCLEKFYSLVTSTTESSERNIFIQLSSEVKNLEDVEQSFWTKFIK